MSWKMSKKHFLKKSFADVVKDREDITEGMLI
jgi:hypothetical protein